MTEISFNSLEPTPAFKTTLETHGFKLIKWIPPKPARKNSRYPTSKYGHVIIEMDRELAHTIGKLADESGLDLIGGAWSSFA